MFGGGGDGQLHPIAIVILILALLLIWLLPRRFVLIPFLVVGILIPLEQQVVIAGLHFMTLRIVLLCAWLRILFNMGQARPFLPGNLTSFDKVFMAWTVAGVITFTILWADFGAFVNRLGFLYNAFGAYFLLRHLLRTREDVFRLARTLSIICGVVAVLMTIEQVTGRNELSIFGLPFQSEVRAGRIRSQGPFLHSIVAGTVGAFMIPVFAGLWWTSRNARTYAVIGIAAGILMAVTSASSTPVAACLAGILALCLWSLRHYTRYIRWTVAALLVALHLTMKAPVWALIGRIDLAGGSTSWQRFALLDNFIRRFSEWRLVGTRNNAQWGFDMWDSVNWYVASGISGGLIGLVLFVSIIGISFASVGRFVHNEQFDLADRRFMWGLGAALFAASVSFFGIGLFDQSIVLWYALLAMIVALAAVAQSGMRPILAVAQIPAPDLSIPLSFPVRPPRYLP